MSSPRFQSLDIFRGLAILMVALYHYTARLPAEALHMESLPEPGFGLGWIGVYFFFVISGYCILLTLERAATIRMFLTRRLSRLYPAFAAAIIVLFVISLLVYLPSVPEANYRETAITPLDIVLNFLFLGELGEWVNGSFWSIAVEVKFYLAIAVMAAIAGPGERLTNLFFWVSLTVACVWMALLFVPLSLAGFSAARLFEFLAIAPFMPFFALGVLGRATHRADAPPSWQFHVMTTVALIVLSLKMLVEWQDASAYQALAVIMCFGALMWLYISFIEGQKLLHIPYVSAGLATIGVYSYSWYLLHETLGFAIMSAAGPYVPAWVNVGLALGGTLAAAYVFSYLFEWRFRKPMEAITSPILNAGYGLFSRGKTRSTE